ncbi:methyltransferase domain-containing protein [candidate division TA06 bacterium]|nr:methyltransferase domain-containing protein [candidate division TA06 bacterium]
MDKPFWEKSYKSMETATFGNPSLEIYEISNALPKGSKILDAGCGDGRNALYLAEKGFSVDAFDVSANGIEKLTAITKQKDITINAWIQDLAEYEFNNRYDLIISHGVLHLVKREVWARFIQGMKSHTRINGLNVVVVFTDALPVPADLAEHCIGLFAEKELRNIYSDWAVEYFKSYDFYDTHPGGIKHHHAANKLIARKR